MSFGNTFENDLLALIFNGTGIANLADDAASGPLTDLYVSLHTADPGEAGTQSTNECGYTSYARVAVSRDGAGWIVSGSSVSPAGAITFPQATGGAETITHVAVGTAASGPGKIIARAPASPNQAVANGVIPRVTTGMTFTLD